MLIVGRRKLSGNQCQYLIRYAMVLNALTAPGDAMDLVVAMIRVDLRSHPALLFDEAEIVGD